MVGPVTCASVGMLAVLAVVVLSVGKISAAALRLVTLIGARSLADSTPSTLGRDSSIRKFNVSVC